MVRRRVGGKLRQDAGGLSGDVPCASTLPGGDVFAGVAMAQAIRAYPGKVTAHIDGLAASAASAVAVAADEAIMAPGSMMMIHNAWTIALGNRHDFMDTAACWRRSTATWRRPTPSAPAATSRLRGDDGQGNVADGRGNRRIGPCGRHRAGKDHRKPPAKFDLSAFEAAPAIQNDTVTVTVTVEVEDSDDAAEQAAAAAESTPTKLSTASAN
jgi:ATP-dependent Clp protease protease subunit